SDARVAAAAARVGRDARGVRGAVLLSWHGAVVLARLATACRGAATLVVAEWRRLAAPLLAMLRYSTLPRRRVEQRASTLRSLYWAAVSLAELLAAHSADAAAALAPLWRVAMERRRSAPGALLRLADALATNGQSAVVAARGLPSCETR